MRSSIICTLLLFLLCITTSVKVRITDRKPKWAVVKPDPTPSPPSPPVMEKQDPQPVKDNKEVEIQEEQRNEKPAFDYNSIAKKRAPLEFTGTF